MAQSDDVAESAGETAGETVQAVVENAVAHVEAAADANLARAEAAEAALETMQDAIHRDALHDEIEAVAEEQETWRHAHEDAHEQLNQRLATLETQLTELQSALAEATNKLTVLTVSTHQPSQDQVPGTAPAAEVTVTTINPVAAAPAPMPESRAVKGNPRHWI